MTFGKSTHFRLKFQNCVSVCYMCVKLKWNKMGKVLHILIILINIKAIPYCVSLPTLGNLAQTGRKQVGLT